MVRASTAPVPALAPCVAALLGVAAGLDGVRGAESIPIVVAACLLLAACARGARRRLLVTVAAAAAGLALGAADASAWPGRRAALVPSSHDRMDRGLDAIVDGAPERTVLGGRRLPLTVDVASGRLPVVCRVAPSSDDATGTVDALRGGDRVRLWARVGLPCEPRDGAWGRGAARVRARGEVASCTVKTARLVRRVGRGDSGTWRRRLDDGRLAARATLDRALGRVGDRRGLAGAMLLGERGLLPPRAGERLRDAGLGHLVAISGLHVGLLAGCLYAMASRLGARAGLRLVALPLLVGFVALVGLRASVLRAAGAAALAAMGRAVGRDGSALNGVAVVAAGLVALRPALVVDAGFQLTLVATGGIVALSRPLARCLRLPSWLGLPLGVSAAAFVSTLPLLATHVGSVAPIGVVTNLLAAPLCAAILVTGYATVVAALALPALEPLGATLLSGSLDVLLRLGILAHDLPGAGLVVGPPALWVVAAHAVALVALTARRTRRVGAAALALTSTLIVLGPPPPAFDRPAMWVIDVGQGQSVLVTPPASGGLLVDAGGSAYRAWEPGRRLVLPALRSAGVRRLDALVVTHADIDHAGGAPAVLAGVEVDSLWLPPGWHREPRLRDLAALARERGAALRLVEAGVGERVGGLEVRVLAPRRDAPLEGNDRSLVLVFGGRGGARALVPGDIEAAGEGELLAARVDLRADVLVLPHHGSRTSSSAALLDAVRPRLAIVSAGRRNPFGHPHPAVLARLRARGIGLRRTDRGGDVRLRLDGGAWREVGVRSRRCVSAPR